MKFGVCARIEEANVLRAAGCDFMECTVVSLRPEESDEAVSELLQQFSDSPLPVEVFNVMLPGDLKVVGEEVDEERIRRYIDKAMERVKRVGGQTVVFGSGRSRRLPDGFARERGEEQLVRYLNLVADAADPLGLTIAIEPLNTGECNMITSVPEAARYAAWVNRPSIKVLADFYHMAVENEPLEHIVEQRGLLRHVHVADDGRLAPGTGQYPYDAFADCIQRAGYDDRISIECKWSDFASEVAPSIAFLRRKLG